MPATSYAPAPRGGWQRPGAPHGRLLGLDLAALDEDDLLPPSERATIYACGRDAADHDPRREPLLLVHGILGRASDLQAVADRFAASGQQIHVLVYRDFDRLTRHSGEELADELRDLGDLVAGAGRAAGALRIVAHSLGGLVTRWALGRLVAGVGIERFRRVHVVGVDNPWQGFGAGNAELDAPLFRLLGPALPEGMRDMFYGSPMFAGEPGSRDPVERSGLFGVHLPDEVRFELVFASGESPTQTLLHPDMAPLCEAIAARFRDDADLEATPPQRNLWRALTDSSAYDAFARGLRSLDRASLDGNAVRAAFVRFFPRFAGDHTGCLREQPEGAHSLPEYLGSRLR